ncbi:MAG TPA: penicillin-binding protein 1C [Anaerolineales bacterium]|nr:penicillin-binding protein 1C [Anaerolineales bacterium]
MKPRNSSSRRVAVAPWRQIFNTLKIRRSAGATPIRFIFIGLVIFLGFILDIFWDLPSIASLPEKYMTPSVRITDRSGHLLYEILPEVGGRNTVLSITNIPQCLKDATIAVEDKNFYTNPGIDLTGIIRALWINLRGGETIAGGSTITQQVARNLLLSQDERAERTLRRKLREAVLAWQMTQKLSKDEILALYLNQINYGGMAYGVEAASQTYFGKPARDLLLPECALLAGLPQAPGVYNPFTNPDLAKQRQSIVLGLLQKQGYITPEQRLSAEVTPLSFNPSPYPIEAPHFIWIIKDQIDKLISAGILSARQSLVVRTTLDLDIQHQAEDILKRRIEGFKNENTTISHNVNNAALVVIDPHSGEILALVGSADFFDQSIDGALDMAISPRQTGSAFKPFIYALALDPARPNTWTAATSILDVSTTFITHDGTPYTPLNYDGREHGPVSVRQALGSSLNVPAVKTLQEVGIENTINLAHRLGITSLSDPGQYDLSLALGGGQISLLQLSTAYAALANNGDFTGNSSILDIRNADGNLLYTQEKAPPLQVFDPRVAWLISDILSDDAARSTGFGLNSTLKLDRPAAVKTGTTTNFHDNWTIGYTPDLLVGVWVGNSGYEAMHNVTGLTGAAPIWHELMRVLLQGRPDHPFQQPDGLTQVQVCDLSGLRPTSACPHTYREWFITGTEPTQRDTFHQQIWIDTLTNSLANDSTPIERRKSIFVLNLPVEAQAWAREQNLPLLADYSAAENTVSQPLNQLVLLSPPPNTTYRIDPNFDPSAQQLQVEVGAGQGISEITVWLDGSPFTTLSAPPYQAWWTLSAGEHHFWAQGMNAKGEVVKSEIVTIDVVTGKP